MNKVGFFEKLIFRKTGKLLKKGEPDIETVAKMVLHDWLRGKIPYFSAPPDLVAVEDEKKDTKEDIEVPSQKISAIRTKENFFHDDDIENETVFGDSESGEISEEWEDIEDVNWEDMFPDKEEELTESLKEENQDTKPDSTK